MWSDPFLNLQWGSWHGGWYVPHCYWLLPLTFFWHWLLRGWNFWLCLLAVNGISFRILSGWVTTLKNGCVRMLRMGIISDLKRNITPLLGLMYLLTVSKIDTAKSREQSDLPVHPQMAYTAGLWSFTGTFSTRTRVQGSVRKNACNFQLEFNLCQR